MQAHKLPFTGEEIEAKLENAVQKQVKPYDGNFVYTLENFSRYPKYDENGEIVYNGTEIVYEYYPIIQTAAEPIGYTLAQRTPGGRLKAAAPTEDDDVVIKTYLEERLAAIENLIKVYDGSATIS